MIVNGRETKETLIGSVLKDPPCPSLSVERCNTLKLLGVHVANDLKWTQHVDAISSKVSSRLYFLRQLKRSGAGQEDMLCVYVTVIQPLLEYACLVWHSSVTAAQTKALKSLQQTAMRIIFQDNDYALSLIRARLDTLESRHEQLTECFFKRCVLRESSCLQYRLPDKRDSSITDKLRHAKTLPTRTVKFRKSFIPHCLCHCD